MFLQIKNTRSHVKTLKFYNFEKLKENIFDIMLIIVLYLLLIFTFLPFPSLPPSPSSVHLHTECVYVNYKISSI